MIKLITRTSEGLKIFKGKGKKKARKWLGRVSFHCKECEGNLKEKIGDEKT